MDLLAVLNTIFAGVGALAGVGAAITSVVALVVSLRTRTTAKETALRESASSRALSDTLDALTSEPEIKSELLEEPESARAAAQARQARLREISRSMNITLEP